MSRQNRLFIQGVAGIFAEEIYNWLREPLREAWLATPALKEEVYRVNFTSIIEPFWTYFSVAIWGGIFVASPFIFYQLWKFVAPGLYQRERRWGIVFAITSVVCFVGGALFCYYLVMPTVCEYMLSYSSPDMMPVLSMQEYQDFVRKTLLGFGIAFELPLFLMVLSLIGLVTHRGLWKFNRWWILLSFIVGAILTPGPDVFSQLLMALPLILLYNLSIVVAFFITRSRERKQAAA